MIVLRRNILRVLIGLAAMVLIQPIPGLPENGELHLLSIQGSATMMSDARDRTLRLVEVPNQTNHLSDRPEPVAGLAETTTFVDHWSTSDNSFADNPPNVTLTVDDTETQKNQAAVILLRAPGIDGADIVDHNEFLGGTVSASGGAVGLFIDTSAPRGGVGPSFDCVGIGARGQGAAGWRDVAARECAAAESCLSEPATESK